MGYAYTRCLGMCLLCTVARCAESEAPQAVEVPSEENGAQVCPLVSPTSPAHTVPCGFCEQGPQQYKCFYCIEGSTCTGDLCGNEGSCDTLAGEWDVTQGECAPSHHLCAVIGGKNHCCLEPTLCCVKAGFAGLVKCCPPMPPDNTAYFACGECVGTKAEAVGLCGRDGFVIPCK